MSPPEEEYVPCCTPENPCVQWRDELPPVPIQNRAQRRRAGRKRGTVAAPWLAIASKRRRSPHHRAWDADHE